MPKRLGDKCGCIENLTDVSSDDLHAKGLSLLFSIRMLHLTSSIDISELVD
jgi:hypothetical protein